MKLLRFILLLAAFLGGYYLGHRPDSPDIFAMAARAWREFNADDGRTGDVLAEDADRPGRPAAPASEAAGHDDPSLTEAALAYLRDRSGAHPADAGRRPAPEAEDLWGYPRPAPRNRR